MDIDEFLEEKMDVGHVLQWIIAHRDNQEAMDEINKVVYPFSSKFQNGRNY
jgi:methyl coenzyme M reductase subunit D